MFERPRAAERVVLVRLGLGAAVQPEDLEEFEQLARSAGALPVATITGRRELYRAFPAEAVALPTPDGAAYVYGYGHDFSHLFLVEGLN